MQSLCYAKRWYPWRDGSDTHGWANIQCSQDKPHTCGRKISDADVKPRVYG
jgi:hypothetical protein